jgi:hypothetical protein
MWTQADNRYSLVCLTYVRDSKDLVECGSTVACDGVVD